jgi:MFS family permease
MNRNVFLLGCAMALGLSGAPVIVLLGGIVGTTLSPDPSLATLPVAMLVTGTALCTVPAALLMGRIGRRPGFMMASAAAALASLAGALAIHLGSFTLFNLAALVIGGNMAFVQQYRFAAAESVEPEKVSRAISTVLLGGIAAAFLGPELARMSRDLLPLGLYSGSFAVLSALYLVSIAVLSGLRSPREQGLDESTGERHSLSSIVLQPLYLTAVLAGLTAYGVMAFIMTATPVSMHIIDHFTLRETAWVIQSHILAMFVPSLFTGALIGRYGLPRIMLTGTLLMTACAVISLVDRHFVHYWTGLVLLGVGWNFLFIGGTTLLTKSYRRGDQFRAQAVNDFVVFGFQALASLSAGAVIFRADWETLNSLSLPLLAAMVAVIWKMKGGIDRLRGSGPVTRGQVSGTPPGDQE